jgi:molybdopterin/thiamine biosynthesis adenylyltransferase
MRVAEVGREKQQNLRHASVVVHGHDLSAQVEALYLAGAGVGTLRVSDEIAESAAAINSEVVVEKNSETILDAVDARAADLDPVAAQIFSGASRALEKMKVIFSRS